MGFLGTTVVLAGDVADTQAALRAKRDTIAGYVKTCSSLTDADRAGFASYSSAIDSFLAEEPSNLSSSSQMDAADNYSAGLDAWNDRLKAVGCATAPSTGYVTPGHGEEGGAETLKAATGLAEVLVAGLLIYFVGKALVRR